MSVAGSDDPVARLLQLLPPLELLRYAALPEAAHLSSLSEDTLLREHRDKVRKLSKRRNAMRVVDALMLNPSNKHQETEIA
jgi:hypothetical protein